MYAAYLDESFDDGNAGHYVVAAVVGDGWKFMKAEKLWHALLAKHGLRKFKSSHMSRRPDVTAEFAGAIRDAGLVAFSDIAVQAEVLQHLDGSAFHKQYQKSPYMLLYQFAFVNIAMKLRQHGAIHSVSFVCDDNARYRDIVLRSYSELNVLNPISASCMGSLSMENDDTSIPIQMADLAASEIRKKAPTWNLIGSEFSPALQLLLESEALCSVRMFDGPSLKKIRHLVDAKVVER